MEVCKDTLRKIPTSHILMLQGISGQRLRRVEQQHLLDHERAAAEDDFDFSQACRRNILLPAVAAAAAACLCWQQCSKVGGPSSAAASSVLWHPRLLPTPLHVSTAEHPW